MTKESYVRHIEEKTGLLRPSNENGSMADVWKEAIRHHQVMVPDCPECKDRRTTRRRNFAARAKHEAYLSAGMVRVKSDSGRIYYE